MPLPPHWGQLPPAVWEDDVIKVLWPPAIGVLTSLAGFDGMNPENFLKP
jgi:hypothetical protein